MTLDYWDVEELAATILGLDEATADSNAIEQALADRYEISFENFQEIVEALMPLTLPAKAAISGEWFQGFVKDGVFIIKQPIVGMVLL